MLKPTKQALAPGQERTVTVHLKSLKNPPLDIKLAAQPLSTSVLDLKNALDAQARVPAAKVKILLNKKPVPDSKVLKELVGEADASVEFTVMVLGGAAAVRPPESENTPTAATPVAGVETTEFWDDLRGYLMQRLKDEKQAGELHALFKSSYEAKK
jgi:hypothetical protein